MPRLIAWCGLAWAMAYLQITITGVGNGARQLVATRAAILAAPLTGVQNLCLRDSAGRGWRILGDVFGADGKTIDVCTVDESQITVGAGRYFRLRLQRPQAIRDPGENRSNTLLTLTFFR